MILRQERRVLFRMMPLCLSWLVLSQGCQAAKDPVEWAKQHHYTVGETVRLEMDRHGFPLVPGWINGQVARVFFDTGNFFGDQIGPRLVRTLKLKPSGNERKNYTSDGTYRYSQKGYWVESFTVFMTELKNIEMFEMADGAFEASVGIGNLRRGRFTLDYQNRLMGISERPFKRNGGGADEFPLIENETRRGMIVIEGRVNGMETLFQIDTGKSRTTIDGDLIARAGLKESHRLFQHGYRVDRITMGRKSFSVECAKVANFQGISEGYPKPILVGIGADILSRIVLTVDYPQKKVFIQ